MGYLESEEDLRVYHGYPPEGPLLCNWNQHFKLDPEFFSVWARIVKQVRAADFPDIPAGAVLTGSGWLPAGAKQHIGYAPVPGGVGITCRACSKLIRASSMQLSACLLQVLVQFFVCEFAFCSIGEAELLQKSQKSKRFKSDRPGTPLLQK